MPNFAGLVPTLWKKAKATEWYKERDKDKPENGEI